MDVTEFLQRARSALASARALRQQPLQPVPYRLGGAFDPESEEAPDTGLDCGTFVRWAARLDWPARTASGRERRRDTTGILADALGPQEYFTRLHEARPGCLIVYPDYRAIAEVTGIETRHDGHVGIVTEAGIRDGRAVATRVIHCSRLVEGLRANLLPGGARDAIIESDEVWFPVFKPHYVWCRSITPAP